jgi:hypothetical protein
MSRRTLAVTAAVAVLAAGIWRFAGRREPPPSDEELIRAAFAAAAQAASDRRPGDVMKVVSDRFQGGGLSAREVRQVVVVRTLRAAWASVTVAGAEVAVDGDRAPANLDVVLAGASGKGKGIADLLPGEASAYRFRCGLEREADGWRVVTAEWAPVSLTEALQGPPRPGG